jgi:hypothetical protein
MYWLYYDGISLLHYSVATLYYKYSTILHSYSLLERREEEVSVHVYVIVDIKEFDL